MKIDLELNLPAEQKDEFGYTPSENKVIEKQITRPKPPPGTWKRFVKANEEADKLIASNKLAEKESPKQTWERLDSTERKRQEVVKKELAEKAADKKHLKDLILFGLENSSEPVIKNPVMRKALEAKPKRMETTLERIERIKYEGKETDKRPKHLDNKNIYSFEDQPKKSVNYLSNNYSFAENFKKQSKNIKDYKPTANKPFKAVPKIKPGEPVKINFKSEFMDTGPTLTLQQHMAKVAPREIEAPGITGLDGVRSFRRNIDIANSKYPNKSKGIGPLLGEDN